MARTLLPDSRPPAQPQFVRAPDFKDIYSNSPRIGVSPFDMTLMFGRSVDIAPGTHVVEELAHIRLSPYQFKMFAKYVASTLDVWESVFGNIPVIDLPYSKEAMKVGMQNLKDTMTTTK